MARLTLRLQRNEGNGQLELRIGLRSDADLLPQEHEQLHRRLVQQLLPLLHLDDCSGQGLVVTREKPPRDPRVG